MDFKEERSEELARIFKFTLDKNSEGGNEEIVVHSLLEIIKIYEDIGHLDLAYKTSKILKEDYNKDLDYLNTDRNNLINILHYSSPSERKAKSFNYSQNILKDKVYINGTKKNLQRACLQN